MDLKFLDAQPTEAEKDAVDELLGPPASGWEGGERDDRGPRRHGHGQHYCALPGRGATDRAKRNGKHGRGRRS